MLSQNTYSSTGLLRRLFWWGNFIFIFWSLFDPLTSNNHFRGCSSRQGQRPHIHSLSKKRTAVSKETAAKNIRLLYRREREEWLAENLVYPSKFLHPLLPMFNWVMAEQTKSFLPLQSDWICFCLCHCDAKYLFSFRICPSLKYMSPTFSMGCVTPWWQMSVLGVGGNKGVMASHLLQHLGQATQVAIWEMLGFP